MQSGNYDHLPKIGVVSMTKVKNELAQSAPGLKHKIENIRVNGQLRGCSGFISDPVANRVVYINTEASDQTHTMALYRTARNERDYKGGRNRRCPLRASDIVTAVIELINDDREWNR